MRKVVYAVVPLALLGLVETDQEAGTTWRDAPHGHQTRVAERRDAPYRCRRRTIAGYSVRQRPIVLRRVACRGRTPRVLVFGCIHGDECIGTSVVRLLADENGTRGGALFLVPDLNPDGRALGRRQNARGVDLNRNFPSRWRPLGRPWDPEYAGPRPLSEPESRLAVRLIARLQPDVTIWLHQSYGARPFVRAWGRSVNAARRFAQLAGFDFRRMRWPAGTAPNWQNHVFPGTASFVVEYPRDAVDNGMLDRSARAVRRLTASPARDRA